MKYDNKGGSKGALKYFNDQYELKRMQAAGEYPTPVTIGPRKLSDEEKLFIHDEKAKEILQKEKGKTEIKKEKEVFINGRKYIKRKYKKPKKEEPSYIQKSKNPRFL